MIRVFIVAGSPLARSGLDAMLRQSGEVEIAGADSGFAALGDALLDAQADVVLAEHEGGTVDALIEELASAGVLADTPVVLLTDTPVALGAAEALRAGVRAVLPRHSSAEQLLAAVQAAAVGLAVLPATELGAFLPPVTPSALATQPLIEPLTRREREVLQMLAAGLGNKEIAARLTISEHTVKFHVAAILGKLGASTRTEAVAIGIRHGLILL